MYSPEEERLDESPSEHGPEGSSFSRSGDRM